MTAPSAINTKIHMINGHRVGGSTSYEIAAGDTEVVVGHYNPINIFTVYSGHEASMSFVAKPGHIYKVKAQISFTTVSYWIQDIDTGDEFARTEIRR